MAIAVSVFTNSHKPPIVHLYRRIAAVAYDQPTILGSTGASITMSVTLGDCDKGTAAAGALWFRVHL